MMVDVLMIWIVGIAIIATITGMVAFGLTIKSLIHDRTALIVFVILLIMAPLFIGIMAYNFAGFYTN